MLVLNRLEGQAMVLQGPGGKRMRLGVDRIDRSDRSFDLLVQSGELRLVFPAVEGKPTRLEFDGSQLVISVRYHRGRRSLRFDILAPQTVQVLREELVDNQTGELLTRKTNFIRRSA